MHNFSQKYEGEMCADRRIMILKNATVMNIWVSWKEENSLSR